MPSTAAMSFGYVPRFQRKISVDRVGTVGQRASGLLLAFTASPLRLSGKEYLVTVRAQLFVIDVIDLLFFR